ncbi:zinc ribbon domain-containing protein [uncultured Anaerococcus sp.]|uniref:zinc ribbon domain-containing protein n=1 Tax=uncultured Anaerococcus sp. TaxID=293428 RepID=UPI00288A41D1|nr:zinc ribbon domain-containing protein [uncultured Anaerococcus sp.]
MKCSNCGADIAQGSKFCGQCGKQINSSDISVGVNNEEKKELVKEKFESAKKELLDQQAKIEENLDKTMDGVKEKVKNESEQVKDSVRKETEGFKESVKEEANNARKDFQDLLDKAGISKDELNIDSSIKTSPNIDAKPSGLIKLISLGSMSLMVIFAIIYIIDLIGTIFSSIGGIF